MSTDETAANPPTPEEDTIPAEGPGGVDAVPDWEAAGTDPLTPDPPRSAQIDATRVPEGIDDPEELDESDGAGSHPEEPEAHQDPADAGKETLTEPADDDDDDDEGEPSD